MTNAVTNTSDTQPHTLPATAPNGKNSPNDANVTASSDNLPHNNLPAPVARHRTDYWNWVENHADTYKRDTLLALRDYWRHCNIRFFDGIMLEPYITLTEPSAPRIYGQCCSVSSWGSRMEIRLRPSLVIGTHPHMKPGTEFAAGRSQFVKDVLLHESIHQHVIEEQPEVDESSYHGHGPVFTAHCNRIGAMLGLPEVVVRNRGRKKLPKAAQWPHCVVPPDRYLGAYQLRHRVPVTTSGVVIPAGYTASAIGPVDETSFLDIDFDTDSGDEPTIRIRVDADTAWGLADFILEYLNGADDRPTHDRPPRLHPNTGRQWNDRWP
jgi:hypothetical protein